MKQQYHVNLGDAERRRLRKHIQGKKHCLESKKRAGVLLKLDESVGRTPPSVKSIAKQIGVSELSVRRYRKQCATEGLDAALLRKKRTLPPVPPKVTGSVEAHIIATCCSQPPKGTAAWTMQMIADKIVLAGVIESISDETVRLVLKKRHSSPT